MNHQNFNLIPISIYIYIYVCVCVCVCGVWTGDGFVVVERGVSGGVGGGCGRRGGGRRWGPAEEVGRGRWGVGLEGMGGGVYEYQTS